MNFKKYLTELEGAPNQAQMVQMSDEEVQQLQQQPQTQDPAAQQELATTTPEEDTPEVGVSQDPDRQGILRKVKHAHLVFKRATPDGTFTELWSYNTGNKDKYKDELEIRKDILAGTDIPSDRNKSDDGSQSYQLWSVGNVQMMKIMGLPN